MQSYTAGGWGGNQPTTLVDLDDLGVVLTTAFFVKLFVDPMIYLIYILR